MKAEKRIEEHLCTLLKQAKSSPGILKDIRLRETNTPAASLYSLIDTRQYEVFEDTSDWNKEPKQLVDIIGDMMPDVVLR